MTATYDDDVSRHEPYATSETAPGERIHGPPSGGLIFVWICWLAVAALMILLGGAVFLGIFQDIG